MSSLKNTIEKIKILEAEKKNLLAEIEGLKKIADAKAVALETEVGTLRDEVKSPSSDDRQNLMLKNKNLDFLYSLVFFV
jgi:hypothetical protein